MPKTIVQKLEVDISPLQQSQDVKTFYNQRMRNVSSSNNSAIISGSTFANFFPLPSAQVLDAACLAPLVDEDGVIIGISMAVADASKRTYVREENEGAALKAAFACELFNDYWLDLAKNNLPIPSIKKLQEKFQQIAEKTKSAKLQQVPQKYDANYAMVGTAVMHKHGKYHGISLNAGHNMFVVIDGQNFKIKSFLPAREQGHGYNPTHNSSSQPAAQNVSLDLKIDAAEFECAQGDYIIQMSDGIYPLFVTETQSNKVTLGISNSMNNWSHYHRCTTLVEADLPQVLKNAIHDLKKMVQDVIQDLKKKVAQPNPQPYLPRPSILEKTLKAVNKSNRQMLSFVRNALPMADQPNSQGLSTAQDILKKAIQANSDSYLSDNCDSYLPMFSIAQVIIEEAIKRDLERRNELLNLCAVLEKNGIKLKDQVFDENNFGMSLLAWLDEITNFELKEKLKNFINNPLQGNIYKIEDACACNLLNDLKSLMSGKHGIGGCATLAIIRAPFYKVELVRALIENLKIKNQKNIVSILYRISHAFSKEKFKDQLFEIRQILLSEQYIPCNSQELSGLPLDHVQLKSQYTDEQVIPAISLIYRYINFIPLLASDNIDQLKLKKFNQLLRIYEYLPETDKEKLEVYLIEKAGKEFEGVESPESAMKLATISEFHAKFYIKERIFLQSNELKKYLKSLFKLYPEVKLYALKEIEFSKIKYPKTLTFWTPMKFLSKLAADRDKLLEEEEKNWLLRQEIVLGIDRYLEQLKKNVSAASMEADAPILMINVLIELKNKIVNFKQKEILEILAEFKIRLELTGKEEMRFVEELMEKVERAAEEKKSRVARRITF